MLSCTPNHADLLSLICVVYRNNGGNFVQKTFFSNSSENSFYIYLYFKLKSIFMIWPFFTSQLFFIKESYYNSIHHI